MIAQIGKYRIEGRLGRGGMGSVYRAYDPVLERAVALKVISAETSVTDELRRRFFHEAQACARLTHPHIVTVFDLGEADGHLFIVMELLEGTELGALIANKRALPLPHKLALMIQVCDGLQYAHQKGIVHRDVKPANIFVLPNGQVKILDFGIARIEATDADLTRTGLLMGTLGYIAPERVRGRGDHRADIFSVGAVLYELLTGQPAFGGGDAMQILEMIRSDEPPAPSGLDHSLPPELDEILARALQKDPARRYDTLAQLGSELAGLQRRVENAAQQLLREVHAELGQVRELEQALMARVGGDWLDQTRPVLAEGASVDVLEALRTDLAGRIDRLTTLLSRAATLQPAFERGVQALASGDGKTAVAELQHVTEVMPEHARAEAALADARKRYREQARREQMSALLVAARNALTVGSYASCGQLLQQLAAMTPPTEIAAEATLIQAAAIAAEQEEDRRQREQRQVAQEARRRHDRGGSDDDVTVMLDHVQTPADADITVMLDAVQTPGADGPAAPALRAAGPMPPESVDDDRTIVFERVAATPARGISVARHAHAWWRRRRRPSRRGAITVGLAILLVGAITGAVLWGTRIPAPDGPDLNALQNTVAAARARAVEAEAQTLAPSAFSTAELTSAAANRLAATTMRESAAQTYRHAADGYEDAARYAHAKRDERAEANTGRASMLAAKQETRLSGADLQAAQAEERRGDTQYSGRDFKAAAHSFRTAATLYAKTPPAPPAVPPKPPATAPSEVASPPDPVTAVRAALNTYVRAIETKDLALLRRVRPDLDAAELGRWSRSFAITQSRKVQLVFHDIAVDGDRARATGRREDAVAMPDGQRIHTETRFVYTLTRRPEGWVLEELQESRETSPRSR